VIAAATSRNARVLAGVAHRVAGCVDTHITGIESASGAVTVTRWFYRQLIEGSLGRTRRPWILLLDPGSNAPWSGEAGTVKLEAIDVSIPDSLRRTTVSGMVTPPADQQTIRPDANLLFVAGAGWTKKQKDGQPHVAEAEVIILDFLTGSKASLGSSKSLVDLSGENQTALRFLSHLNQVGQTGASPRHPKGLATCCYGEEPHTVGWRFIGERRAINLDSSCGCAGQSGCALRRRCLRSDVKGECSARCKVKTERRRVMENSGVERNRTQVSAGKHGANPGHPPANLGPLGRPLL
jgi:electron transfer flavoprotein alpha subunit